MFKRILVPLDGSKEAERALPVAARLARASGGSILLVEVIRPPIEYDIVRPPEGTWLPTADSAARDMATAYLAELREREVLRDVNTDSRVLVGRRAPLIINSIEEWKAELVIMVTSARHGLSRLVLGSVADEVVRDAGVPVLALREASAITPSTHLETGDHVNVLVTLDGSPLAEAALVPAINMAAALSQARTGAIQLLYVVEPPPDPTTASLPMSTYERAEVRRALASGMRVAREYLRTTATHLRERYADELGITVTWSVERGSDVAEAILRAARLDADATAADSPRNADIIAMGTHGRSGIRRLFMGSVAERVLREATVPVLIVRPDEQPAETMPTAGERAADTPSE